MNEYDKEQFQKIANYLRSICRPIERKLNRTESDLAACCAKYIEEFLERS